VLSRGFESECPKSKKTWDENHLRKVFEEVEQTHGTTMPDRQWQMDLADTYEYVRKRDNRQFATDEALFSSLLSRYPLNNSGYVELASYLFWDSTDHPEIRVRMGQLFRNVQEFIDKVRQGGQEFMMLHWGAAKFLLDSGRKELQESLKSHWRKAVNWKDFRSTLKNGVYVLDFEENGPGPEDEIWRIQAAMLEMTIPVIPSRLRPEWKDVLHQMDILDLPGMVASGAGETAGGSNKVESTEEQMMVVKRGKVFFLIDRYITDREIQTLLMLQRGGNQQVRGLLKENVDKWGKIRYGEQNWPEKIPIENPAFFIGMTGIDDEFKDRPLNGTDLYTVRLNNIVENTFSEVVKNFGGKGRSFTNIFPLRYPGTWDKTKKGREASEHPQNWEKARKIFSEDQMVRQYVKDPERRWDAAMDDIDGGMIMLADGFRKCTTPRDKQDDLEKKLVESRTALLGLAKGWLVDPNSNYDRQKRIDLANRVLDWLHDKHFVHEKVRLIEKSITFSEGELLGFVELFERRSDTSRVESKEARLERELKELLEKWKNTTAPQKWQKIESGGWKQTVAGEKLPFKLLSKEDFSSFVQFLYDYFLNSEKVFDELCYRLKRVILDLNVDRGSRIHVLREYSQLVLNDFVMNPGPSLAPLDLNVTFREGNFGLMNSFLVRWQQRLPFALASAAGAHTSIPEGNSQLEALKNRGEEFQW